MLTPYDEVEYPGFAYPDTHPDRLATLATLFGLTPAPLDRCRVLELACGDGANLVPIALSLPGSTCVGVDVALTAVERARDCAAALGLGNVTFHHRDVAHLGPEIGEFDYVIAHGLYSWVGADVRDRLLAVCKAHLAPDGVAFVSYNTYPGGHIRQLVRNMMLFRARAVADPERQVGEGLALVRWVMESTPSDELRSMLKSELDTLSTRTAPVIYHDELAATYTPVYFHEFVDHARRHGLQYLAEAEFGAMQSSRFPAPLADTLHKIGDVLVKEQLQDFLRLRKFRQTLLCHAGVRVDRAIDPGRVRSLRVASNARPESQAPDLRSGVAEDFRTPEGWSMSTDHALAKAAILCLADAWPRSVPFGELVQLAEARLNGLGPGDSRAPGLEHMLLAMYTGELVELHVQPPAFTLELSGRPVSSSLVRWQLQRGTTVTTLRHTTIKLEDALLRHLVSLLDGMRDHAALVAELTDLVVTGAARLERDGRLIVDKRAAFDVLSRELPQALGDVARLALIKA